MPSSQGIFGLELVAVTVLAFGSRKISKSSPSSNQERVGILGYHAIMQGHHTLPDGLLCKGTAGRQAHACERGASRSSTL